MSLMCRKTKARELGGGGLQGCDSSPARKPREAMLPLFCRERGELEMQIRLWMCEY